MQFVLPDPRRALSFKLMKIQEVMTRDPVLCGSLDSLEECARYMYENNVGMLFVKDADDKIVGVLTDRDIVCAAVANGMDAATTPVTLVMERDFQHALPGQTVEEVLAIMQANGIRRVPVMDGAECVGVVSMDDLILKHACSLGDIERIIEKQLSEPSVTRAPRARRRQAA